MNGQPKKICIICFRSWENARPRAGIARQIINFRIFFFSPWTFCREIWRIFFLSVLYFANKENNFHLHMHVVILLWYKTNLLIIGYELDAEYHTIHCKLKHFQWNFQTERVAQYSCCNNVQCSNWTILFVVLSKLYASACLS